MHDLHLLQFTCQWCHYWVQHRLPALHNNMRARGGRQLERGGQGWQMSRIRHRTKGAAQKGRSSLCVCECLEKEIRNPRGSAQKKRVFLQCQIWNQREGKKHRGKAPLIHRAVDAGEDRTTGWQHREIKQEDYYSLGSLTRLVSTVTTWEQWWALWPCKPSRGDHPEVRQH